MTQKQRGHNLFPSLSEHTRKARPSEEFLKATEAHSIRQRKANRPRDSQARGEPDCSARTAIFLRSSATNEAVCPKSSSARRASLPATAKRATGRVSEGHASARSKSDQGTTGSPSLSERTRKARPSENGPTRHNMPKRRTQTQRPHNWTSKAGPSEKRAGGAHFCVTQGTVGTEPALTSQTDASRS